MAARSGTQQLIICLALVSLILANLIQVSGSAQDGPDMVGLGARVESDKLVSADRGSGEIDLSAPDEPEVSNSLDGAGEGEEEEASNQSGAKKFTWEHHPDDHGHYSGRALISSANIEPKNKNQEEDEQDELERAKSSGNLTVKRPWVADQPDALETEDFVEKEWQLMFRALDIAYADMSSSMFHEIGKQTNLFDEILARLKPQCRRDINHIRNSIKKHKLWALRMVDSNGKLPSGVTRGRFSSPGDFEECLGVQVDETIFTDVARNLTEQYKFHGKYCLLDFRLPLPERPKNKLLSIHESVLNLSNTEIGKRYPDMIGYSSYASAFYEVGYLHAFCLPSSCDVNDLTKAMGKAIEGTYLIVNNTIDCEERDPDKTEPLRRSQVIALLILGVVFSNAFLATLAHYLLSESSELAAGKRQTTPSRRKLSSPNNHLEVEKDEGGGGRQSGSSLWNSFMNMTLRSRFYSDCFSIQKNFERLTKPDPRGLTFIHYTRLVAMALTVITHTGALGTLQAITKPADASNSEQIFRDFIPQVLANAFTSIQIFFFMAGFMLVISTFPSIVRDKGHISFLEYAVKRAIRLMPGIAATICINFLWPLVVDGPMLKYFVQKIVVPCEINWWHTLGFISNFDHVEKMCLRHSYFSASDYQLHIIAFPLLILLYKRPSLALALAGLLTVSGFVVQVIMILTKTVLPFMMVDYIDKEAFFNVVHYIHHPVWNHMAAFFYGFIVGYLVVKQIRYDFSPTTIKWMWYITAPAGLISIFAPYFWNHYKRPIHRWQMVLYIIFDRSILLTTCAWLSYASMVLARKPPNKRSSQQQQQPATKEIASGKTGADIATFDPSSQPTIAINLEGSRQSLCPTQGPPGNFPRQHSSPNLAQLQQQHQVQQQQQSTRQLEASSPAVAPQGRLSKTMSSSNLATIEETGNQATRGAGKDPAARGQQEEQTQSRRPPTPVSNINILCLVLSRLTFQLYLFNMVVLWVDVNHSKYYWFFSYYFIIFKGAAVYICSAFMAMIFFVVLESPCLTLYIAWVKSRAASRAKQQDLVAKLADRRQDSMGGVPSGAAGKQSGTMRKIGLFQTDTLSGLGGGVGSGADKPTFSFIDLSSTPNSNSNPIRNDGERLRRRKDNDVDQTRM